MSRTLTVDLILPCYNPRPGWERSVVKSISNLKRLLPADSLGTVILVNDGSETGFSDEGIGWLLEQVPETKVIQYTKNRGKGYAVRKGIRSSAADLQIYTDVDMPYADESVVAFYHLLANKEADVVVASRDESYYSALSGFRRLLSKTLRWLNGVFFGMRIKDTQGGLKGFNEAGREAFLRTRINRYLFDLEFIQMAIATDLRLAEVEVTLKSDIALPSPSPLILLKELHNFIRLLTRI